MAKKTSAGVERPTKSAEYSIRFATRQATDGWRDLVATQNNAVVDAWDELTKNPRSQSPKRHPLRADLQWVTRDGKTHERWQYELSGGARIWYYTEARVVYLEQVHTHHPNQTK